MAAIALAVVALPVLLLRPRPAGPARTPTITPIAGKIVTVPEAPAAERSATIAELGAFLEALYDHAFIVPPRPASPPPATPAPVQRIRDLFTPQAIAALSAQPDLFSPGPASVTGGRVAFDGVVTFGSNKQARAYLTVRFDATAIAGVTRTTLSQFGNVFAIRTSLGWRIEGFELHLDEAPATPTPTPGRNP